MLIAFSCIFLSEIGSDKWTSNKSYESEWSEGNSENRKNNNRYYKSNIASPHSPLGSSEFFGSSCRNDIIENS